MNHVATLRGNSKPSPPCKKCKGQCCTFPPMTMREFKTIRKKHGIPNGSTVVTIAEPLSKMVLRSLQSGECSYLKDERCSIYKDRPWICRVYGDNDLYPCSVARPLQASARAVALKKMKEMLR